MGAAALVVDSGIYGHGFVAQAVVDGLMRASLDIDVPVLSVFLTPHNYREALLHQRLFREHFVIKGREAATAVMIVEMRMKLNELEARLQAW